MSTQNISNCFLKKQSHHFTIIVLLKIRNSRLKKPHSAMQPQFYFFATTTNIKQIACINVQRHTTKIFSIKQAMTDKAINGPLQHRVPHGSSVPAATPSTLPARQRRHAANNQHCFDISKCGPSSLHDICTASYFITILCGFTPCHNYVPTWPARLPMINALHGRFCRTCFKASKYLTIPTSSDRDSKPGRLCAHTCQRAIPHY